MRAGRYDLVVIGGGTGGLVSALIAAGVGARVALIERERTGGDCLWTGCVPSKSLLAAGALAHRIRHADDVGLQPTEPVIDFARVMRHVDDARRRIAPQDSPERLRSEGVDVIEADASFLAPGRIVAGGRELRYRKAIVATGSRPAGPPIPGLAEIEALTSDTLWGLRRLPERLAVLGGGPIGCEMAQAFARLGSRVTLVEMAPRLLLKEEPRASELIAAHLVRDGVDLRLGGRAESLTPGDDGHGGELAVSENVSTSIVGFDRILLAAGRRPDTADLGLTAVGVESDARGAVLVDKRLRTTGRDIYAVGDVTGALPFTHVAAYHARVATVNALFAARRTVDYAAVPWVTFTDPEVGRAGMTEDEARSRWGGSAIVTSFDYEELDRAITGGDAYGFVKLIGDPKGRLVGATVAAPQGGEAIAELAAWIATGARIDRVSQTVHAYPTMAEGQARAADAYLRAKLSTPRMRALTGAALRLLRILDRGA